MTAQTDELVRTEAAPSAGSGDRADDLWHIAANDVEDRRADARLSWVTLCGQRRPPARERKDPWIETHEDCAVCVDLAGYGGAS